jgi:hypothetical protein
MRKSSAAVFFLGLSLALPLTGVSFAATHVIEATANFKWKSGGQEPADGDPLVVEVAKGDILDIQIAAGNHGVATIDKPASDGDASEALGLVLACGEDAASKPDAVLREIECGAASQFNKRYIGSMKLEVLDKFAADTHFWCIVHVDNMWATLKLKQEDAANTIVIEGTQAITWKSGGQESTTDGAPLVVEVAKGDIIDFQIPAGPIPHGVVTIDKPASEGNAQDAPQLVLACGEDSASKPDAVLQEVECGAASQFAKRYTGSMKLEVLDKFVADTHFWCIIHFDGMWGLLKLKPKT